ncbi:hypothetical protein ANCCAN_10910 [Ancylostoma caninum]|uniref:Uncharacterized protein n=1 Tax=Ancylostoma caninum TaxID=29170 RepID=A0A368GFH3_ANCCA|nr:hypothetical protein ANCCAN_10910 [Ancylostoma caninum]
MAQALMDKIKNDYDSTKNKDEKRTYFKDLRKLKKRQNSRMYERELNLMLGTRLTGICANERRKARS